MPSVSGPRGFDPHSPPLDNRHGCVAPFHGICPPLHQMELDPESGQPCLYLVLNTQDEGVYFHRYVPHSFTVPYHSTSLTFSASIVAPATAVTCWISAYELLRVWRFHCLSTHQHPYSYMYDVDPRDNFFRPTLDDPFPGQSLALLQTFTSF